MEKTEIDKDYKDLGKGSFWSFIGLFLGRFLGIIFTIIIARLFSPEEVGLYYLAFSVVNLFTIFTGFELISTLQTYSAYYYGKGKLGHLIKLVKMTFFLGTITSLITFVFFIIFPSQISSYFNTAQISDLLKVFAFYFILNSLFGLAQAFTTSFRLMKEASIAQSSQVISKIILIPIIIYFFGATSFSLSVIFVISFAVGVALALRHFFKLYLSIEKKSPEKVGYYHLCLEVLPFTSAIIATNIVAALFSSSDRIMLGRFLDPSNSAALIAVYSISLGFGTFLQIFSSAIGGIFVPIISSIHGRDEQDFSKINELTNSSTKWSFIATGSLFVFLMSFPSEILGALYGGEYITGGLTLFLITLGFLYFTLAYSQKNVFPALKRADIGFKITLIGVVLNILLNIFLIPKFGIEGAAFSFMFFHFITFILAVYYSKKLFNFTFSSWLLPYFTLFLALFVVFSSIRPEVLSLVRSISLFIFSHLNSISSLYKIFEIGLLFLLITIVYLIGVIYLRLLNKNDKTLLLSFLRKLKMPILFINFVAKLPYSET